MYDNQSLIETEMLILTVLPQIINTGKFSTFLVLLVVTGVESW
jgi:hypothetical protein